MSWTNEHTPQPKEKEEMRRISEQVSLHGKAEKISIMDFRKRPGEVLQKAALGMTIIITKQGKEVAYLTPFEMTRIKPTIKTLEMLLSSNDDNDLRILPNGQVVQLLDKP